MIASRYQPETEQLFVAMRRDVICLALDVDARRLWIAKNGRWMNGGSPQSKDGAIQLEGDKCTYEEKTKLSVSSDRNSFK